MEVTTQISAHIAQLPEPKRGAMQALHESLLLWLPGTRLWFDEGKNEHGKVVANPTIGYGLQTLTYANGSTKPFFQVGISGNTTGISVYILGIKDKTYLPQTYGKTIGKASVTGYCIKFKALADIHLDVLGEAVLDGVRMTAVF
ncbi:DUF1801 domain-containing protein [Flavobacterium sp.]|uniref:DUF1801 domain-containing protein n=1 Tax=Flavobacterium sp. TaxID=239 RepID=UPI0026258BAB|nr:DUF1801 domain-containing protein [Flavobacterium sp.]